MAVRRAPVVVTAIATFLLMLPATAAQVQDEYIVVLNPTNRPVADVATDIANAHSGQVGFVYESALQGFTLRIPQAAANGLARNPNVAYVEPVQEVEAVGTQPIPTGIDRMDWDLNVVTTPMDVDIAILDTGVYIGTREDGSARSHLDLNLKWVSDCTGAILYPLLPGGCTGSGDFQDYHGHGTHVAGIAAAYDNDIGSIGVAPGATLWSFKVLQADGTGTTGMILAGIDAVASQADQIEVANMSLGFVGTSAAIDEALANAKAAGVVFVVAAGNDGIDASQFSPASSPDVVTVSALSDFDGIPGGLGAPTCRNDVEDDKLAVWSNFGPAVEIAAPGVCIYSTDLNDGYSEKSGTSMASPAVAGAMARYIAEQNAPTNNASDVDAIVAAVLGDALPQESACGFTDVDSSPEPLLFLNGPAYGGDGTCGQSGTTTNAPPTADFSFVCTDLSCDFTDLSSDSDGTVGLWDWDFGGTGTSTAQNPSHAFPADGTYAVTLTATDDDGDSGNVSYDVTVSAIPMPNNPPVADYSYECTGLHCDFTDLSTDSDGTVGLWDWDFGGTGTSTAQNPSHTFPADGTYAVTLTATDDDGDSGNISYDVTVSNNPPTASFTSSCTDLTCTFTNTSTDPDNDPLTYLWSFGDGINSTATSPTHDYASAGTYTVTLTADDGLATDSATDNVSPTEAPPPANPIVTADAAPFSFDGKYGNVSMLVFDDGLQLVGGATVEGTWAFVDKRGRTRTNTSSTVSSDQLDFSLNPPGNAFITKRFPKGSTPIEFCITSVSAAGYDYEPAANPCVPMEGAAAASADTVAVRSGWRAA